MFFSFPCLNVYSRRLLHAQTFKHSQARQSVCLRHYVIGRYTSRDICTSRPGKYELVDPSLKRNILTFEKWKKKPCIRETVLSILFVVRGVVLATGFFFFHNSKKRGFFYPLITKTVKSNIEKHEFPKWVNSPRTCWTVIARFIWIRSENSFIV